MAELLLARDITLNEHTQSVRSLLVPLSPLTSAIVVKLQRPTTATPLPWARTGAARVTIGLVVDGAEHTCSGQVSGGIRTDTTTGEECSVYELRYLPTVLFGDAARRFCKTAVKDGEFILNVPLTRIGQLGTIVQGYVRLDWVRGEVTTKLLLAEAITAPAPVLPRHKNSVAFDAATDAQEISGDGVLSLSHTSTGNDRAVRAGVFLQTFDDSTTLTYGGTSMTAEHAAVNVQNDFNIRAWYLAGPATGSQTVTSSGTPGNFNKHALNVISVTGVDQVTPVGTSATAQGTTGGVTVTVSDVVTDGMVLDFAAALTPDSFDPGANQTLRNTNDITGGYPIRDSTQSSNDGGVMSWSGTHDYWGISAVEFKPAGAGGGGASPSPALQVVTTALRW